MLFRSPSPSNPSSSSSSSSISNQRPKPYHHNGQDKQTAVRLTRRRRLLTSYLQSFPSSPPTYHRHHHHSSPGPRTKPHKQSKKLFLQLPEDERNACSRFRTDMFVRACPIHNCSCRELVHAARLPASPPSSRVRFVGLIARDI